MSDKSDPSKFRKELFDYLVDNGAINYSTRIDIKPFITEYNIQPFILKMAIH